MRKPESVLENETLKILGDFETNGSCNLNQKTKPCDN